MSIVLGPVPRTVIDNALTATRRDMGVTMMKTSDSPIFNESLDFARVIHPSLAVAIQVAM